MKTGQVLQKSEETQINIDGKGFQHKQNPRDQPRVPKAREWRKKNENYPTVVLPRGKKRDL